MSKSILVKDLPAFEFALESLYGENEYNKAVVDMAKQLLLTEMKNLTLFEPYLDRLPEPIAKELGHRIKHYKKHLKEMEERR